MDLYLNIHSTDLSDSNNEISLSACKIIGHMLSKWWRENIPGYDGRVFRYSIEIDNAYTESCRERICDIQWNCRIINTIDESYTRSNNSARYSQIIDEYDRSNVRINRKEFDCSSCILSRELYVKEIIKSETMDSLLQILLYKDLETKQ